MVGEGPTDGINDSFDAAEKNFSINFSKAKAKFYFNLHYKFDSNYFIC